MRSTSAPTFKAVIAATAMASTALAVGVAPSASAAPTTFTVDTLSDNPADGFTLREAVADANANAGADRIEFADGLTGTVTLTAGELESTDDLELIGPGTDLLTIDGDNSSRVLSSSTSGISLTLEDLTIANGQVIGSGGGVAFGGDGENLTVRRVAFVGNQASNQGGGLWVANPTSNLIEITDTTFEANRSGNAGGGLYLADSTGTGDFDLSGNTFHDNETVNHNGGGAYVSAATRSVFVDDSVVEANQATNAQAGGLWIFGEQVMVTDSLIVDNVAGGSDGGVSITADTDDVIVSTTTFARNEASDAGAGSITTPGNIEFDEVAVDANVAPALVGLHLNAFEDIRIMRSTFTDNVGGAESALRTTSATELLVLDSTFDGNEASTAGPLAILGVGASHIESSTFSSNSGGDAIGEGGAVRMAASLDLDVVNSTFVDNNAFDGGAIYATGGATVSLSHVTMVENDAANEAGGVFVGAGGDVGLWNSIVADNTAPTFPDVNDAMLDIDNSLLGDGAGIIMNGADFLVGVDPELRPLDDNGGPTKTMMPELTSPAIDGGYDQGAIVLGYDDQRGRLRSGTDPDMGSVEVFDDDRQIWVPTTPARFVDTRANGETVDGENEATGMFTAGEERQIVFAGRGDVPADAVGVVANITAVGPASNGYITAHSCVEPRPNAASLNYTAGVNLGNEIILGLDNGDACVYSSGSTQITIDVVGYISATSSYAPIDPARYADTRDDGVTFDGQSQAGGAPGAGMQLTVDVAGRGDVPVDAVAAVMYVAAVSPSGNGFVTVWDCASDRPLASSLNHVAGVNRGNEVIAEVSADGEVCFFTSADVQLTVDVVGYIRTGTNFEALDTPSRLLDSRPDGTTIDGQGQGDGIVEAGTEIELTVAGRVGIPGLATTATINITAVNPAAPGYITVYDCVTKPLASSLNYVPGVNGGNEIIAGINANGRVCLFTSADTHLTADITGYTSL